jgi:tetratricopeptide (TPR) repeat protein
MRLSSSDTLPAIAAARKTEPDKLAKLMRGELDWIVLKALEKDRTRRYETANDLAADVQHYLCDEAVHACPPSAAYRFRKFARRNKAGLFITGLVLFFVVLLGGGIGWIVRDKAARRAQTADDIDGALREAQVLQDQQKWPEALAVVKHAQVLWMSGAGDENGRQRLSERLADLEMVVKLEDARLRAAEVKDLRFDIEQAAAAYAKAFREYGIDVEAMDPKEAGALLRTRSIGVELAAALDDWVRILRSREKEVWQDRLAVARVADPDPFRDRVREAVARGDRKALEELAAGDQITDLSAPTLLLMAEVLEGPGVLERRIALLEKAQQRHPGDFWVNIFLALLSMEPAQADEAIRYTSVAVALRPQSSGAYNNLGVALGHKGRRDEAIAQFREAIRLQGNALAHNNLGSSLRELGRLDEAVAEYREAIRLKLDWAEPHVNIASILKDKGRLDEAIAELREAIRLKPDSADFCRKLVDALRGMGRLDEAIAELREATRLKRDMAEAHSVLGYALRENGQLNEAIAEYREAIRLKPDWADARRDLGRVLRRQNRPDEAIDCFRQAITLAPKNVEIYARYLGDILEKTGKLDEAMGCYRQALSIDPNYAHAYNNLAWIYATSANPKLRDPKQAVISAKTAVQLDSRDGNNWNTLGAAHYAAGDWKASIDALNKSMHLQSAGDANAWFFLAMAGWQLGQKL